MNEKMYQCMTPFCEQISAHEPNHRLNGDESPRESTHHVHCRTWCIFEQKIKTWKHNHHPKIPVHSSNNDTKNLKPSIAPASWRVQGMIFKFNKCICQDSFWTHDHEKLIYISFINTLWLNDYIWPHRTGSALARVMAPKNWTSTDLALMGFCGTYRRREVLKASVRKTNLRYTLLNLLLNISGVN